MKSIFLVGIGGMVGSICRYLISNYFSKIIVSFLPTGTFIVNIVGCFLIGVIYEVSEDYYSQNIRLLLATGFCGGFTTFSAFASENLSLLQKQEFIWFSVYTLLSIILGIVAVWLGIYLVKYLQH